MTESSARRQLPRFAAIGGVGFVVDGALLTLLVTAAGAGPVAARAVSFPVAATTTWYLNRKWTFLVSSGVRRGPEYARYIAAQVSGAVINLAVYLLVLQLRPKLGEVPLIPLAIGALIAMIFNFAASRYWVFQGTSEHR